MMWRRGARDEYDLMNDDAVYMRGEEAAKRRAAGRRVMRRYRVRNRSRSRCVRCER